MRAAFGALLVGLAIVAAACGDDDDSGSTATTTAATETTAGSETSAAAETTEATETTEAEDTTTTAKATTTTGAGATTTVAGIPGEAGALEGFKGTTPLVELSQDFKDRLLAINPSLIDYNYAAETYDAIDDHRPRRRSRPRTTASPTPSEINGITRDGEKCTDFATLQGDHRRRRRPRLRRHLRPARVRRQRRAARGQLRPADVRRQQPHRRRPDRVPPGYGTGRGRRARRSRWSARAPVTAC